MAIGIVVVLVGLYRSGAATSVSNAIPVMLLQLMNFSRTGGN